MGSPQASGDYRAILETQAITCSMSRRANCYDNAVMESFFATVKSELGDRFAGHGEAKMELFVYREVFYDQRRRHSTIGQVSPAAFEKAQATRAAWFTMQGSGTSHRSPKGLGVRPIGLAATPTAG